MTLNFSNGFSIELLRKNDNLFLGLGSVQFQGTPLRDGRLPWTFYTESEGKESGWRFETFHLDDVKQSDTGATLTFTSEGRWLPRVQAADAMGDARVKTRRLKAPVATFRWSFRQVTEKFWENEWPGLAMQLEIDSPDAPVHWVVEDTTWELGGSAEGCVLIQQDVSTIDLEQKVAKDSAFSTIEKFFTETEDAWGGNYPMDMLPRAAGAAICDFQAKDDLALCIYAPRPNLTRARLEKFSDETVIHYTERPFVPLTTKAVFPERRLLVHRSAAPLQAHEKRNLWLDCFTSIRKIICDQYGFTPEIPRPSIHSHLWDDNLKALGKTWMIPLRDSLPRLQALGYEQVFTHGVWDSITSDPNPPAAGNICCPYDFRFAESFGGPASVKALTDAARACGIDIFQWFSFHLSRFSPLWKEHPDWVLREANGDPWDGNYGDLWSGRIHSDYGKWFETRISEVIQDTGLAGIFWDSYQNLGVTGIDWRSPEKSPQAEDIFEIQARLQRQGCKQKCEVVTIFGVSNVSTFGFDTDAFRRRRWSDSVRNDDIFALIDTSPGFFTKGYPFTREKCGPDEYFWMAGHRILPALSSFPWKSLLKDEAPELPGGDLAEDYGRVNHLYQAALPHMKRLRLQPEGTWALWLDDDNQPAIAWVFRETTIPFHGTVHDLGNDKSFDANGETRLAPGSVYRLTPVS